MTGDSHSNEDADFLDEDFVVEDLVGKNDDLEDLFDEPRHPRDDSAAKAKEEEADEDSAKNPDEDDILFTDHSEDIEATEEFQKPVFAEDGVNEWDGDHLDLESVGVPDTQMDSEEAAADPQVDEAKESFAAELGSLLSEEEDFALDSEADLELVNLSNEIDDGISEFEQSGPFVLDDGDGLWADDLEEAPADAVADEGAADVDAAPAETVHEAVSYESVSQQVPGEDSGFEEFELGGSTAEPEDEGITLMSAGDQLVTDAFGEGHTVAADGDDESLETMSLRNAAAFANGSEEGEAGWEPLPSTSINELSEVDGVQRTDDDEEYDVSGYEEDEPESVDEEGYEDSEEYGEEYAGVASETDLDDVDGHDIYAEDEAGRRGVVLGGPGQRRSTTSLLLSVAASLLVLFGAAMVVVRPELFGLSVEPQRVAKVDVARPKVEVAVVEPPQVALQDEVISRPVTTTDNNPIDGNPTGGNPNQPEGGQPQTGQPEGTQPETGQPQSGQPEGGQPDVAQPETGQPVTTDPPANTQPNTVPTQPADGGTKPIEVGTTQPVEVLASAGSDATQTPVAGGNAPNVVPTVDAHPGGANAWPVEETTDVQDPSSKKPGLARFGDGLMVGGVATGVAPIKAMDGVMPGSRAFAQLHNGNYFIGKVKHVADETITLRVETGEVTLATAEIATLTRLGTTDYDELQKATKGFVRLTNNNRLIGGILSRIADDHIVLEFRSNRVMLPRSAIGEIVSGQSSDDKVRLGTTTEEDSWIRSLAKRQLGTGQGAPVKPDGSTTPTSSEPPR